MIERKTIKALPSSFVAHNMKPLTDRGSGEAKLWVGQMSLSHELDDFFGFGEDYTYSFSRHNLCKYLDQVKLEYAYQLFNKYKNVSLKLWNENYDLIRNSKDTDFLFHLEKFTDQTRYYVRSDDIVFRKTFRNLALPKITDVVFEKNSETKTITILLELNLEYENLAEEADDEPGESMGALASNILLYGVPGAGKSFTVEHEYIKGSDKVERVVFHPDYTYSDFVGQILPVVHEDKSVSYEFVAGPFTRILKAAWNDLDNHYWLIIEEINRGNASAIFGDLFQLLDRKDDGTSEYEITNADIAKVVFEDHDRKVGLPGNLSIIATMNTSDQNVFTLDTAFQRRWRMRLIDNDFDACEDTELMTSEVVDTGIQWKDFGKEINRRIVEANSGNMISTADKQLGTHFVSKNELSKTDVFAEKVLKYLWDDAVKLNHEQVFDPNYKELREVVKDFKAGDGIAKLEVFNKTVRKALQTIIDGMNDGTFDSNEEPYGSEDN